jgi:hypothetical protein
MEHKFYAPEAGSFDKSSCLAPALGATKFAIAKNMIWSPFVVLIKSDLYVEQTHLSFIALRETRTSNLQTLQ